MGCAGSVIIHNFAIKSSFFMSLGACRLKKRVLGSVAVVCAALTVVSCGSSNSKQTTSGLRERVLASQSVTSATLIGGLFIVNGYNDTIPRLSPISAGLNPGLMAISPSRNLVSAFDSGTNRVFTVNTTTEQTIGGPVQLPGLTQSIVIPTAAQVGYAAVPSASVNGYTFVGAIEAMNLAGAITTTIAVPNAQTVVANSTGNQLLVFSSDSDSVTVLNPLSAVPPVDLSCLSNPPNAVCTIVPGFSRPVNAIVNDNTAYILNCGFECGGSQQASVAIFDLNGLTITNTIPVNGATYAFLSGSTLYVAGLGTTTGPLCSSLTNSINHSTAATYCGTLDIIDLNTMTDPYYNNPAMEIAIPDGFHDQMDLSVNGQLFVGSIACQNIGDVGNPSGEVRGCLAIYNTTNNTVTIPPDNGDVDGLQSFTSRYVEYVAEGGNLRVYNTTNGYDVLLIDSYIEEGTIDIIGYVGDIKAIDFF
jgi:DNA-binding beta-propeller fold protein YncE